MSEPSKETPFSPLGEELKTLREKNRETLDEVSGAVEVEINLLERFEKGSERPSEDVLMLLLNHFNVCDDDAVGLWQLAGYDNMFDDGDGLRSDDSSSKSLLIMMALDNRILYSDNVQLNANRQGLVLTFLQNSTNGNLPLTTVARIGMSHEHARDFMRTLAKTLRQVESLNRQKRLPPNNQKSGNS